MLKETVHAIGIILENPKIFERDDILTTKEKIKETVKGIFKF